MTQQLKEWADKPVGFVGYGMGSGGANAVRMTTQVVTALRMVPATTAVTVPLRELLDGDGVLHPSAAMERGRWRCSTSSPA